MPPPTSSSDLAGPFESLAADWRVAGVVVTVKGVGRTKSGNDLSGDSIWLYKIEGGKIARAEFYGDTATAVQALR